VAIARARLWAGSSCLLGSLEAVLEAPRFVAVSMMWARWVSLSTTAFARRASGNTFVILRTEVRVTIIDARSFRSLMTWNTSSAAPPATPISEFVEADDVDPGVAGDHRPSSRWVSRPVVRSPGRPRREPHAAACWHAKTASEIARCVFPVPLSPSRITDSRSSIQLPCASAAIVACGLSGSRRTGSPRGV